MEDEGALREFIRTDVALATRPAGEIAHGAVEHVEDERPEVWALAWSVLAEEMAGHLAAQRDWPEVTDSDRLTAAFRELSRAGIVAREDFACCQNCGLAEIGGEVPDPAEARGYAFYHHQDATAAADGGGLYVAFGQFGAAPLASTGEEVAGTLRRTA